ncbi:MAG: hypothetical protein Q9224_004194 [Gallowayella concinna]
MNLKPIVKLPPTPVKATNYSGHISLYGSARNQAEEETHNDVSPRDGPFKSNISAENRLERFKRLTASPMDQQQIAPSTILDNAFVDRIHYPKPSVTSTRNSHVPKETSNEVRDPYDSTPQSTPPMMSTAVVSSQTAGLLLEGARRNWQNICEALMAEVGLDDKEILDQIAILVRRLGTESGLVDIAQHSHSGNLEVTTAIDVGTAITCVTHSNVGAIKAAMKDAATQVPDEEEQGVWEDKEELQARRERIGLSLMMRRQEQPFRK